MVRFDRFACPACEGSSRSGFGEIEGAVDAGTDVTSAEGDARADAGSHRRRTVLIGTAGAAGFGGLAVAGGSRRLTDGGTDGGARTATGDSPPSPTDDPTRIAHRGFAGENPENTLAAARAATREDGPGGRADLVEFDVVATGDGDVVVFHDDELAGRDGDEPGVTDADGVVWETDTETVTSAAVLGSGETVPRLDEMLDAIPTDVGVNVELKNPGDGSLRFGEKLSEGDLEARKSVWGPFVDRVLAALDATDHEVLLSSFYEAAVAVAAERSTYPVAPILWDSVEDGLAIAERYDAAAVHPPAEMIRRTPFFDDSRFGGTDIVEAARADGRAVNVWTVETWYQAERLVDAGVDGLIADYSTLLSE
ncbi:glycerophosphodiester phosphodiesterase [Halorubrum lipolyticum]|uniref:Glycerophosphoryl diester phosphodiesterase n=1 Tax=Halorubrum lipolyticum DSM 21995 TaxID=1227482 RepID=M0NMP5_9EURY|nr:glycerophosphodiester phosphodiesterase [Halorubrum lipolyticum]EMA59222.1 glycerophosphoryl diester phosphodiesterase [Halorubrum lipolyticum DSM 21995]